MDDCFRSDYNRSIAHRPPRADYTQRITTNNKYTLVSLCILCFYKITSHNCAFVRLVNTTHMHQFISVVFIFCIGQSRDEVLSLRKALSREWILHACMVI